MSYSHEHMIGAFAVTACWDVVLRQFSERRTKLIGIEDWKWVRVLQPYFQKHTVLGAALIAGFVGAVAYTLIHTVSFVDDLNLFQYLIWVVVVSAIVGIPMRYSKLFPHLEEHYYKKLGFRYSMMTDAFSGVVVCLTMFLISIVVNGIHSHRT